MPTYKVDELEVGAKLDAAVALAEGYEWDGRHFSKPPRIVHGKEVPVAVCPGDCRDEAGYPVWCRFHPSGDWSQGGTLVEANWREITAQLFEWFGTKWRDSIDGKPGDVLVWLMRAFAASRLGATVDLPW